MRALNQMQSAE